MRTRRGTIQQPVRSIVDGDLCEGYRVRRALYWKRDFVPKCSGWNGGECRCQPCSVCFTRITPGIEKMKLLNRLDHCFLPNGRFVGVHCFECDVKLIPERYAREVFFRYLVGEELEAMVNFVVRGRGGVQH